MNDEMVSYIKENPGTTSRTLALEFFKMKSPDEKKAHIAINAVLSKDARCFYNKEDGSWNVKETTAPIAMSQNISQIPFVAVYLLTKKINGREKLYHVSLWKTGDVQEPLLNAWMVDPQTLPAEEAELLCSVHDVPFSDQSTAVLISQISGISENNVFVFLSSYQQNLFYETFLLDDSGNTDRDFLISNLFRATQTPLPRPLTLESCCNAVFTTMTIPSYAYKHGDCFMQCVMELLTILKEKGVFDLSQLEYEDPLAMQAEWFAGKSFTIQDIFNAPKGPGVYGFKNKEQVFIYIGKAKNLRKRLMTYFRETEESPDKISRIRQESHGLVTHACGSELESLLFEYRLIKKHNPVLNKQVAINERKGEFVPIDDCIILLPHTEGLAQFLEHKPMEKGMSFWFRKNQKIKIRPFASDFTDKEHVQKDIREFYFSGILPPDMMDFPEQEIGTRWVKKHVDELNRVYVNRYASPEEVCDAMKGLWDDMLESHMLVALE
jgi:hypothetical protein